jgi:hypothetical protein
VVVVTVLIEVESRSVTVAVEVGPWPPVSRSDGVVATPAPPIGKKDSESVVGVTVLEDAAAGVEESKDPKVKSTVTFAIVVSVENCSINAVTYESGAGSVRVTVTAPQALEAATALEIISVFVDWLGGTPMLKGDELATTGDVSDGAEDWLVVCGGAVVGDDKVDANDPLETDDWEMTPEDTIVLEAGITVTVPFDTIDWVELVSATVVVKPRQVQAELTA